MTNENRIVEYLPGHIDTEGVFHAIPWSVFDWMKGRDNAVTAAKEHAERGLRLLRSWGVGDVTIKPAIQTRYTNYEYEEAEEV